MSDIKNKSISCNFQDDQDHSMKTCNVVYGRCGEKLNNTANSTNSFERTNFVQVLLNLSDSGVFCYKVMASNATYSVLIEGSFTIDKSEL